MVQSVGRTAVHWDNAVDRYNHDGCTPASATCQPSSANSSTVNTTGTRPRTRRDRSRGKPSCIYHIIAVPPYHHLATLPSPQSDSLQAIVVYQARSTMTYGSQ
jgi:hypothetical protein